MKVIMKSNNNDNDNNGDSNENDVMKESINEE